MRGIGAALLIPSIVGYTACLGLLGRVGPIFACAVRSPQDGWQRYVFAAWAWLFVSLGLGPGWTFVRLFTGGAESLLLLDFARHAMAFGFAAQMVLGVASRVVPNFTGKALWSPGARDAAFYLLNASMVLRALEVPIGLGVWPEAWAYIAWAGPLGGACDGVLYDEHHHDGSPATVTTAPAGRAGSRASAADLPQVTVSACVQVASR